MQKASQIAVMEFPVHMGQERHFDLVFRTYHQPLLYYAKQFVPEDDADDLIENLFLKLWHKSPEIISEAHLRNYLYLSLRNSCLDFIKVKGSEARRYEKVMAKAELTEQSHMHTMISAEVMAEIYRAINSLPLQCARVISMSYLEGKSNIEIAEEMGLSEQTVKNHKVRGLKVLRENLSGEGFLLLVLLSMI